MRSSYLRLQRPSPAAFGIAIALVVTLVLGAAWAWSRGGQTTHVRLEARAGEFKAYIDGRLQAESAQPAPADGGIILQLENTEEVPSLPTPRGIDYVRVTDLNSGEVLFQEDFSKKLAAGGAWNAISGNVVQVDGVLGAHRGTVVLLHTGEQWRDYALDVRFKNVSNARISVRAREDGSGVHFVFRPFRHYDDVLSATARNEQTWDVRGHTVEPPPLQTVKSMVAMALGDLPLVAVLVIGLIAGAAIVQLAPVGNERGPDRISRALPFVIILALAVAVFVTTLYIHYSYSAHMPHVPDELSYLFQAKVLASGHLAAAPPPVAQVFDIGDPPLIEVNDGKWASLYPFGHPFVLAIGLRIGAVWLIPPVVGTCSVILLFLIGRQIYGAGTALLAALLLASSPFFLMNASN